MKSVGLTSRHITEPKKNLPPSEEASGIQDPDYFAKRLIENTAVKKLHAAEDLGQIFFNMETQLCCWSDEWNSGLSDDFTGEKLPSSPPIPFESFLDQIKLILSPVQDKFVIPFWTTCQKQLILKFLMQSCSNIAKLKRKLQNLSSVFKGVMNVLCTALSNYPVLRKDFGYSNITMASRLVYAPKQNGWKERLDLVPPEPTESFESLSDEEERAPSGFKLLRKSVLSVIPFPYRKKKSRYPKPVEFLYQNAGLKIVSHDCSYEDTKTVAELYVNVPPPSSRKPEVLIKKEDLRPVPKTQIQAIIVDVNLCKECQTEDDDYKNERILCGVNAIVDRIMVEASAELQRNEEIAHQEFLKSQKARNLGLNDNASANIVDTKTDKNGPPYSSTPSRRFSVNLEEISESNVTLLSILKCKFKHLHRKIKILSENSGKMELDFSSDEGRDTDDYTEKTWRLTEIPDVNHLVRLLKEAGKLFKAHPGVHKVMDLKIQRALDRAICRVLTRGHDSCIKLEEIYQKVRLDYTVLNNMLHFYHDGHVIDYGDAPSCIMDARSTSPTPGTSKQKPKF